MPRRAFVDTCPPGTWCLSPLNGFLGILCVILFVAFIAYILQTKSIQAPYPKESRGDTTIVMPPESNGDDRYTRAPEPQRFWNNGPEIPPRGALIPPDGGIPINIPTQGWPESYQPMGLLKQGDGKLLPLYGRRVASRADRFNYYTRTDTYNPVPLPIQYKKKDCQDPVGCQELFDGDSVRITPTGEEATATLYRFDGPMYVPGLI
jgi:hypothetical protein